MTTPEKKADLSASEIASAAIAAAQQTGSVKAVPAPAAGVVKRTNAYFADPKLIGRKEGWNPRFDFGEIEELAKSIKANGVLLPLRVKRTTSLPATPGQPTKVFELIDGDRRLTAIELIMKKEPAYFGEEGVPVIIVHKEQDDLTSLFQMFESNSGKAFLPLEEATAYKRMRDAGLSIAKICERVGRKQVHVVATLALLDADTTVQEAVKDGSVNSTLAKKIAVNARGDKAKQKELIADAKAAGKDKKARRVVKEKVEQARQDKAKKAGRVLKIRALTDDQLSAIGVKMSEVLMAQMAVISLEAETDLTAWMAKADPDQQVAFTFGVLQGLKAAAGLTVNLLPTE